MLFSRRFIPVLALALFALPALVAQSSSSNPADGSPSQAQPAQSQGQLSVQARLKARRDQRRAKAIQEAYGRRWEVFAGTGYLLFKPGVHLQKNNQYPWVFGVTRYSTQRLGFTAEGRGYTGSPFIPPTSGGSNMTQPTISEYSVMAGPTYRFYQQPKFVVSGRVMGGYAYGNFSGDMAGNQTLSADILGLYHDGASFAVSAAVVAEYNISPQLAIRVAPEYYPTGFDSKIQNSYGFTSGIVMRFGKVRK